MRGEGQHGFTLVPLTRELADELDTQGGSFALNGSGTCSADDLKTSCFATERCNCDSKAPPMRLHDLLHHRHKHVAYTTGEDGHKDFVGCVSAEPATRYAHMFPNVRFHPDDVLVFNLCVAWKHRNPLNYRGAAVRGAGRSLLSACGATPYLAIRKTSDTLNDSTVRMAMDDRVERLQTTYAKLGCVLCNEMPNYFLLRREQ